MNESSILNQLQTYFQTHAPRLITTFSGPEYAVLVPLIRKEGEYHVLFEVRSATLRTQPGDVCFPGGRIEMDETPLQAAIRETAEELLIAEEQIEIITPLNGTLSPTGTSMWPFLGEIHGYENTFSTDEVAQVFTVPLSYFITKDPEKYMIRLTSAPGDDFPPDLLPEGYKWRTKKQPMYFYRDTPYVIWGATARILRDVSKRLRSVSQ